MSRITLNFRSHYCKKHLSENSDHNLLKKIKLNYITLMQDTTIDNLTARKNVVVSLIRQPRKIKGDLGNENLIYN